MSVTLTITKDDVVAYPAPELAQADIDDTTWTLLISLAGQEMSATLGTQDKIDRCGRFLVAHMATLLNKQKRGANAAGGAAGPLQSVKVGPVEKTFATVEAWTKAPVTAAVLGTTSYGQEYLRLIRIFLGGSGMVSSGLGPVSPSWPGGGCW